MSTRSCESFACPTGRQPSSGSEASERGKASRRRRRLFERRPPLPTRARRRAAGIYGTIVTAAVIAAGGNQLSSLALELTVLVTLVAYWLAEEYAELLAEQTHAGHLPSVRRIGSSLSSSWPMVSASFLPLLSLILARIVGASSSDAAEVALIVALGLLLVHGYSAGRAAGLTGVRLYAVTGTAGVLGAVMVMLKALLQTHHY